MFYEFMQTRLFFVRFEFGKIGAHFEFLIMPDNNACFEVIG